ncbi:MAG: nitroreductase family protein [Deltaproteobacteria bacterium]|nr:nitroreductase family protein [Deltaproteobacteria bacterium]
MNEVIANIKNRRSIRRYKPEQLSDEELSGILEAGQFAPSGGNNQTTHLIAIQNKDVLRDLKRLVEQELSKMLIYEGMYKSLEASIKAAKKGGYDFIYHAPTLVVAANRTGYGNAMADCACVLENMMLAATSLRIGSCWINQIHWLDENPVTRTFMRQHGLAENETICGSLALGYSAMKEQPPLKRTGNPITYVR